MTSHKKIGLIVVGVIGVMVLGAAALLLSGAVRIPHTERTRQKLLLYDGESVALPSGGRIEQEFTAVYPGLSQIEVLLGSNPTAAQQPVTLHLRRRCESSSDIATASLQLAAQTGPRFYTFALPAPLDDSAGQQYCLVLAAPQAGEPVTVPLSQGDLYPHGPLTIVLPTPTPTPQPTDAPAASKELPYKIFLPLIVRGPQTFENSQTADIGFLLRYEGLLVPSSRTFFARLVAHKPYLWGSKWFYVGLISVYVILLVGLTVATWKTVKSV